MFDLRNCKNFQVLCKRFERRNTRQTFIEATIAHSVFKDSRSVEIIEETGVRGEDFDFRTICGKQVINIEVTEKSNLQPSVNTIKNTLRKKRDQFPKNEPAILYIVIPNNWAQIDGIKGIIDELPFGYYIMLCYIQIPVAWILTLYCTKFHVNYPRQSAYNQNSIYKVLYYFLLEHIFGIQRKCGQIDKSSEALSI